MGGEGHHIRNSEERSCLYLQRSQAAFAGLCMYGYRLLLFSLSFKKGVIYPYWLFFTFGYFNQRTLSWILASYFTSQRLMINCGHLFPSVNSFSIFILQSWKKDISSNGLKLFSFNFIGVYLSPLKMLMFPNRSCVLHFSRLHREVCFLELSFWEGGRNHLTQICMQIIFNIFSFS